LPNNACTTNSAANLPVDQKPIIVTVQTAIDVASSSTPNHREENRKTPPLTAAALAAHTATLASNTKDSKARIDRLQNAARELGFELPERRYKAEKCEIDEWVRDQNREC
jgi:hypothetical protein